MSGKWREAVWAAVNRRARDGIVTRAELIEFELDRIVAEVGSKGRTPHQTLSRELQELRDAGVLIFDGDGNYRIASGLTGKNADEAIATEVWRLQRARRGQGSFRDQVMKYWHGVCPLTGIQEPELLRASHIIPWNRCEREADRLNPDNGLLLSSLWDAAFDRGLVSFSDDGEVMPAPELSELSFLCLCGGMSVCIYGLNAQHRENLAWHRANRWRQSDMPSLPEFSHDC